MCLTGQSKLPSRQGESGLMAEASILRTLILGEASVTLESREPLVKLMMGVESLAPKFSQMEIMAEIRKMMGDGILTLSERENHRYSWRIG